MQNRARNKQLNLKFTEQELNYIKSKKELSGISNYTDFIMRIAADARVYRFAKATNVLNASKKEDGTLPKASELKLEIEEHLRLKKQMEDRNLMAKAELNRYRNIKDNVDMIVTDKDRGGEASIEREQVENKTPSL